MTREELERGLREGAAFEDDERMGCRIAALYGAYLAAILLASTWLWRTCT